MHGRQHLSGTKAERQWVYTGPLGSHTHSLDVNRCLSFCYLSLHVNIYNNNNNNHDDVKPNLRRLEIRSHRDCAAFDLHQKEASYSYF